MQLNTYNNRFLFILDMLWQKGSIVRPRGLVCKELANFQYYLNPRERFMCFDQRKLKLDYVKQEFLWYVRGIREDLSIATMAKMWQDIINPDGTINSNYGYYLFNPACTGTGISNFERIAQCLEKDPDSRRAAVMILGNHHLNSETKDYPCTAYINFLVRKNWLNMYVRMRSQDAIFGMGNDAPCFSFVHELMYARLKKQFPMMKLGRYWHLADSFHVYERHFDMVQDILENPQMNKDYHVDCPPMDEGAHQLDDLQFTAHNLADFKAGVFKPGTAFGKWLVQRDDPATLLESSV